MRLDRIGGPQPTPDGRSDALTAEVTGQAGRVADETEAGPSQAPRRPPAHDVGVTAERLDRKIGGDTARAAQLP